MPAVSRNALVPYSAGQMFELVDDIESYSSFLPWCRSSQVLSRDADEVRATLEVAASGFNKSFTTCNRLQQGKMIEMRLVEGPFKHLQGFWRFDALSPEACKVSLDLEFEFNSGLMAMALGPIFGQIANGLMDAFLKRAGVVYGSGN